MNPAEAQTRYLERRPERNGRGKLFATLGAVATIVVAVPVCLSWIANAVEVAKTPSRLAAIEKSNQEFRERMAAYEAGQKEVKESLARIEGAMRIPKEPNKKP